MCKVLNMTYPYIYYVKIFASAPHHFNSEAFLEGRGLIIEGMAAIKANIREENFHAARETLGKILHTLQVREQLGLKKLKGQMRSKLNYQTVMDYKTHCHVWTLWCPKCRAVVLKSGFVLSLTCLRLFGI